MAPDEEQLLARIERAEEPVDLDHRWNGRRRCAGGGNCEDLLQCVLKLVSRVSLNKAQHQVKSLLSSSELR